MVKEEKTGKEFNASLGDMSLIGTGCRVKKVAFVSINVYAIGKL